MSAPVTSPFSDLAAGAFGQRRNTPAPAPASPPPTSLPAAAPLPEPIPKPAGKARKAKQASDVPPPETPPVVAASSAPAPKTPPFWTNLSIAERRAAAGRIFIYDQPHKEAILKLDRLREDPPGNGNAHCMLITGPTGTGKTVLLHQYAGRFAQHSSPRRDTMTVALTTLVGVTDGRDLAFAVIKTLNPVKRQRPASILDGIRQVQALAHKCETEVIVIDKVECLCAGNAIEPRAREFLCELLDRRIVGTLVLVGDASAQKVFYADSVLENRVHNRIVLADLAFEDDAVACHKRKQNAQRSDNGLAKIPLDRDRYVKFLETVQKKLPVAAEGFATEGMAERFHFAVGGNRRAIMNLVTGAVRCVLDRSPDACLGSEHLALAFADAWPDRLNPFLTMEPPKANQAPPPLNPDLLERLKEVVRLNR